MEMNKIDPIDTFKDYHEQICDIWKMVEAEKNKTPETPELAILKTIYDEDAFVQDFLYKKSLLFLGVGASSSKSKTGEDKKKTVDKKGVVQYETDDGRNYYHYYDPMIKLAEQTGFEHWSNIDITLFRETNQDVLIHFFKNDKKYSGIMEKQLELAIDMIIKVEPEIIVVSNAFVRKVLRPLGVFLKDDDKVTDFDSGFRFEPDKNYGTPIIIKPEKLKGKPVFFSSMLSGQRALDKGSFELLIWHINFVKKQRG
jgi:hypothetical protein